MRPNLLPTYVFESNLSDFAAKLAAMSSEPSGVVFDFQRVQHYIPAAIAAVVATVKHLESQGKSWQFRNHDTNSRFSYFQRMDVCSILNIEFPWDHSRNDPGAFFVPLAQVDPNADCARLANALARCMAPEDRDAREIVRHLSSEMMLNSRQHSGVSGFAAAQYVRAKDYARIGVADYGRSILGSFRERQAPFHHSAMTDVDALQIALQTGKSSTLHLPVGPYGGHENAGVGLSMAAELVRLTHGEMVLVSGSACCHIMGDNPAEFSLLRHGRRFHGTLVSLCLRRNEIGNCHELLTEARRRLSLQAPATNDILFES